MKTINKTLILLLSAAMFFVFASPAFSALSTEVTSDVDLIQVDKTAKGTKLSGPLTIYYVENIDETTDMHIFLRLRKGADSYGFSTVIENVLYEANDIPAQQADIEAFIASNVIPVLYEGVTPPPLFAIKSYSEAVQDEPFTPACCNGMFFAIMDVVIAVQD